MGRSTAPPPRRPGNRGPTPRPGHPRRAAGSARRSLGNGRLHVDEVGRAVREERVAAEAVVGAWKVEAVVAPPAPLAETRAGGHGPPHLEPGAVLRRPPAAREG